MSSKRAVRRKSCEGKKKHVTFEEAQKHLREHQARFGDGWIRVYKCKFCGQYHIGHPDKKTRQAIVSKRGS